MTVCDAAEREDGNGFWHKALCRITRDATKKQLYRPVCFEFVKDKHYDAAISYGEWISPEFVAEHVQEMCIRDSFIFAKKRGISFFQKRRSVESKMHKFLLTVHA